MITIRAVQLNDCKKLAEIYNYYVVNTSISYEDEAVSASEFSARVQKITKKYPYIVAENDGVVIGYAYASSFRERVAYNYDVELSVYIDKNATSKGTGSLLLSKLIDILKEMNFLKLYSLIDYPNEKSMAIHEKFEFKQTGFLENSGYKFDKWLNVAILEKDLGTGSKPKPIDFNWKKFL